MFFMCPLREHHWYHLQDTPHNISYMAALMVAITGQWFRGLSETTRNLITVGSVLVTGFGIGLGVSNLYGLPSQVSGLESQATINEQVIAGHIVSDSIEMSALRRNQDYQVRLSEWMACAIAAQEEDGSTLQMCGVQPTRIDQYGVFR